MITNITTFLRANSPYWFRTDSIVEKGRLCRLSPEFADKTGYRHMASSELEKNGMHGLVSANYDCFVDSNTISVAVRKASLIQREAETVELLKNHGRANAESFRSSTKTDLICTLAHHGNGESTDILLSAFCKYTHYDTYSAWLYNHITKVFTRIAGRFNTGADYLPSEACGLLTEALNNQQVIVKAVQYSSWCPDNVGAEIKWCNALNVKTAPTTPGEDIYSVVVCFYSQYEDFNLRTETVQLIRAFVQQNLADRYFDRLAGINKLRTAFQSINHTDHPIEFMRMIATQICEHLSWESCAIFLCDSKNRHMLLQVAPKSEEKREYPVEMSSLTTQVFREQKLIWSYDIKEDQRNSHHIDDDTATYPRDWIGVPIIAHDRVIRGVIRVKNRIVSGNNSDTHFNHLDISNLEAVALEIGSVLHQRDTSIERKRVAEERAKELANLEDFLRTFRHEIGSPIQAICFAPESLGLIMQQTGLVRANEIPKKLRDFLVDFKATGQRLEMIAKALTLDPDQIVKHIVVNNLYKDCIAPVMAFMTPYIIRMGRRVLVDKQSLLANVECDSMAISIAFHVLMDNALKYSDKGTLLRVYGEHSGGGPQVVVENRSAIFVIHEDEVEKIREKYVRGSIASEQKLDGSGIGLYLADRIMKTHGCKLLLLSRRDPVRFALHFSKEAIP